MNVLTISMDRDVRGAAWRALLRVLEDLRGRGGQATCFFPSSWGRAHGEGVRMCASLGCETALLTHAGQLADHVGDPLALAKRLAEDRDSLQRASGQRVDGHRLHGFLSPDRISSLERALCEAGFAYESNLLGRETAGKVRRLPHRVRVDTRSLCNYPVLLMTGFGYRIPIGGEVYLRLLPYPILQLTIRQLNQLGHPAIVAVNANDADGLREKLSRLMRDFQFRSIRDVFGDRTVPGGYRLRVPMPALASAAMSASVEALTHAS